MPRFDQFFAESFNKALGDPADLAFKMWKEKRDAPGKRHIEHGKIADAREKIAVSGGDTSEIDAFMAENYGTGETTGVMPPAGVGGIPQADPLSSPQDVRPPSISSENVPFVAKEKNIFGTTTKYGPDPVGMDFEKGKVKAKLKWNNEAAERAIKFEVMEPKLNYFMDVGGRAYNELKETASGFGVDLNFEEGGWEAIKALAVKNVAVKAKLAPLMNALDRLRPELGTELMRQIGAFRSGEMAERFEKSLAQFSGDIREDIANMTTTIAKNIANIELLDDDGEVLSRDETLKRMKAGEANLVRKYNYMYRKMGLTTKPYTAGLTIEQIADRSSFSEKEEAIIKNVLDDNPKFKRKQVVVEMIKRGDL